MAFPFLFEENFDAGTLGNFNSETDTSSILDYPHYAELARFGQAPWQGAHAMRGRMVDDAVGYVTETDGFDTAGAGTIHIWGTVLIGADVQIAASGVIVLFALDSAGPVAEASLVLKNDAGQYQLAFGETGATRVFNITRSNKIWYEFEMSCLIDNAGANDGTLQGYIDGAPVGAVIGTLDQGAITQARFGIVSGTAAGDKGTILFGGIIADDARIYPRRQKRFSMDKWVTRDINAFVGQGELDGVSLTATDTNGVLNIYDTDIYEATGVGFSRIPLIYTRNVTANDQSPGMTTPVRFEKGCYVQLAAGANPQAFLSLKDGCPAGVMMSDENYVQAGRARRGRI
jgi:hypothetical protein